MEDVLDVYERPYNPNIPQVCVDERPCTLLKDVYLPLPIKVGTRKRRIDYEYARQGTCSAFMIFEPHARFRQVEVRKQRTNQDFAHILKYISDELYPEAKKICLVLDNLNTHTPAVLYQTFSADEAHRLKNRFEFHYTPVHASWLNMVEIEISVWSRQCLRRRIDTMEKLAQEAKAWATDRNAQKLGVDWRFTARDARVKLERLYNFN